MEAFGYGTYENARDISALHIAKAGEENLEMKEADVAVDEYDDHALHEVEHVRYLLSAEYKKTKDAAVKERIVKHIAAHKEAMKKEKTGGNEEV